MVLQSAHTDLRLNDLVSFRHETFISTWKFALNLDKLHNSFVKFDAEKYSKNTSNLQFKVPNRQATQRIYVSEVQCTNLNNISPLGCPII